MTPKKRIILAIASLVAFLAIVITVVTFLSFNTLSREVQRDRTANTWSFDFESMDEKLSFLAEYLIAPSEVLDAEYHVVYHDNSGGLIPGPSDWDIRVALKIKPHDINLWTEGFDEISSSEIDLAWWDGLATGNISWQTDSAVYYRRSEHFVYLVVFPNQSVILKAISTMPYSNREDVLENAYKAIIEAAYAYEPYSLVSADGAYTLQTERIDEDTGVYLSFFITLNNGSLVFRCPDKYRAMDLKSITWSEDSREVVVVSSDVGTYRYDLPKPLTYEIRARLHESMPEYRFVATGIAAGIDEWSMGFVMGLDVFDENGLPILSMDYSEEFGGEVYGAPVYLQMMDTMGLHVTDVNFDGYRDIIILTNFAGTHSNTWYDCWLWDAKSSSFIFSESFAGICNPSIDREEQRIFSTGGSGAAFWGGSIYKFIDGEFVITNNLDTGWTGLVETQLVNEKMEIVREVVYSDDTQIQNSEVDREMEYYKNHELWQLEHPRWIWYGGHHADEWLAEN